MTNMPMNPMNMLGNMMQNNPVFAIINAMKNGGNPMALLETMASKDQRAATAFKMINGKNQQQLEQMARGMCREAKVTPEQVLSQFGINMPK